MGDWKEIGEVTLLQIQTGEMTAAGSYDTTMLIPVDSLRLNSDGVFGHANGAWVVDRHHRHHPAAKYWHSEDVLSFGFTSHYRHMWDLFRPTPLGIAGENVIVVANEMVEPAEIAGGIRIETAKGGIDLTHPTFLEPCVEFTRFMTSRPDASAREVKPDREKLRKGVRGFAAGIDESEAVEIGTGDAVSIRTA